MLGRLRHGIDALPVAHDSHERRWRWEIAIPDVVLDRLKMPDALAGVRIEREERVGEQVVAGTVGAVEIGRGGAGGDEDESTFYIDCHSRPVVGAARVGPGVLRPGVVAVLAGTRNGVERPAKPPGADVVGADVAARCRQALGRPAADDVQILVDDARRRQAHRLLLRISAQIEMKIDAAAAPEIGERFAGREIDRVDVAAKRGQQSLFFAVSPVGEAADGGSLSCIPRPLRFVPSRHRARRRCLPESRYRERRRRRSAEFESVCSAGARRGCIATPPLVDRRYRD